MPELTERANFREVLLKGRLAAALRKLNLREGHHGPAFWAALGRAIPDWQERKEALLSRAKEYLICGLTA